MAKYIKSIQVRKLYGHMDFQLDFTPTVNVIYGNNGGGKTTLLHLIINILNKDFDRFAFINFDSILLEISNGQIVSLRRFKEEKSFTINVEIDNQLLDSFTIDEIINLEPGFRNKRFYAENSELVHTKSNKPILPTVYFPAFRVVIEALHVIDTKFKRHIINSESSILEDPTIFIRNWLLPFIPRFYYPSLVDIENSVNKAIQNPLLFDNTVKYLSVVNEFLENKILTLGDTQHPIEIIHKDGFRSVHLEALSSGERQIVTMLFTAMQKKRRNIILIDEPEISLHVDWQRKIIKKISELLPKKQIIVCTHSPIVASDFEAIKLGFL